MCIFSQTVEHVAGTKIFARELDDEQLLAYEMSFGAAFDLAMVLPLPVRRDQGETGVRFIDLSGFSELFTELSRLFPALMGFGGSLDLASRAAPQTLVVHQVGAFEASYVPSIADFTRLDPRFRLPKAVWEKLPQYRDFGFAVFKLRGQRRGLLERIGMARAQRASPQKVHPMALAFKTSAPGVLFFPTVHVHDGVVHAKAQFDHELYCQIDREPDRRAGIWERASEQLRSDQVERSAGLLAAASPCFRLRLIGELANDDVRIGASL